jgi:hypothetical protein
MYVMLANTLESTELRSVAISEIQFGLHFKDPLKLKPNFIETAYKIFDTHRNEFIKYASLVDTEEKWKQKFSEVLGEKESDFVALIGSISGVTRPKDRLFELISKWRNATQFAWESFVSNNPDLLDADKLREFLYRPRGTKGVHWKRFILEIADAVSTIFDYFWLFLAIFNYLWLFIVDFQVLSPFYSSIKRRKSSPAIPAYMGPLDSSIIEKAHQREMMATPQFETAVLAYLMNTGGACWKEDQEKKRELFLSEVKKAKATKGVPVPSRDKEDRHHTKCTWASDKAAALAKLKEKNRDRYNIARSKMELFTCPSPVTAFDSARQILEKKSHTS